MEATLSRLQLLEDKIRYAEKKYRYAVLQQESAPCLKSLKVRIDNLKKERSLYHDQLQSYKSSVPYLSPLYKKIESILPYQASRYV
jgi:uncharacterized coiled-coil DUF342 family protein